MPIQFADAAGNYYTPTRVDFRDSSDTLRSDVGLVFCNPPTPGDEHYNIVHTRAGLSLSNPAPSMTAGYTTADGNWWWYREFSSYWDDTAAFLLRFTLKYQSYPYGSNGEPDTTQPSYTEVVNKVLRISQGSVSELFTLPTHDMPILWDYYRWKAREVPGNAENPTRYYLQFQTIRQGDYYNPVTPVFNPILLYFQKITGSGL